MKLLKAPVERLILMPYENNFTECALAYLAKAEYESILYLDADTIAARTTDLAWYLNAPVGSTPVKVGQTRSPLPYAIHCVIDCHASLLRRGYDLNALSGITMVLSFDMARLPPPGELLDSIVSFVGEYGKCLRFYEQGHLQFIFYYNISKFDISGNDMENNQIHHFSSGLYMEKMKEHNSIWFAKTADWITDTNKRTGLSLGQCIPQQWGRPWP